MNKHPWLTYSRKVKQRVVLPLYGGTLLQTPTTRVVIGQEGALQEGSVVKIYLLVDEETGVIEKASFQAVGDTALIAAADTLCELVEHKNYAQASRMSAELIDRKLRDDPGTVAFPSSASTALNRALFALMEATMLCQDIAIKDPYAHSPVQEGGGGSSVHYEHWATYSLAEKLSIIKEIIAVDVAPYVALDEGGVEVKELRNDTEVIVAYQGACTTCFSATGSTLSAIQQILKDKVHPHLTVSPDLTTLQFAPY